MINLRCLFTLLIITVFTTLSFAEEIQVEKITLARFKTKNGKIIGIPKSSPYWPKVDRHILTVDDAGNIYILNLWNNEILVYDDKGKLQSKIRLKVKLNRFEYRNGALEVSKDGKRFWVDGYDQFGKIMQFIFDKDGKAIRQLEESQLWPFPDIRLCDENYAVLRGGYIYDQDFHLLKEKFTGFADAEGKYKTDLRDRKLIKYDRDGKKLWGKQFSGNFEIIGVDKKNYVYIKGMLRKGDSNSLYRLDSKGNIIALATIPDTFPFLTQEEKDEREMHASEEFLSFFRVTCDGNVYLIYQLSELPAKTFKRWLKGGEYFIYKFEMASK